jgi:3-phosphoshikimate 1-carboxyvinyltransferase
MMLALGVPLELSGSIAALDPSRWSGAWKGFDWDVPGDLSSAAFLVAAALVVPGSELRIRSVGTNPTRTGFIDALRLARIPLTLVPKGDLAGNEPISDIFVESSPIFSMRVGGELLTRMIDEVPILTVLAAAARGRSEIRDADELRTKESDRIHAMHRTLSAFGADATELQDGLTIHGGAKLHAATVESEGDHRVAMSAVVLGLIADGETIVNDVGCVETSFPGFAQTMRALGANVIEEEV